jgi:hypothetical protein
MILSISPQQQTTMHYYLLTRHLPLTMPVPFASGFKHRLLIMNVLMQCVARASGAERERLTTYQKHAFWELQRYTRENLPDVFVYTHLEPLLKAFHIVFIPRHDKDFPPGQPSPATDPGYYGPPT